MNAIQAPLIPFQGPQPWAMKPDMVINDVLDGDPRLWTPLSEHSWSRPLHMNTTAGFYVHVLRVTRAGLIQRHRHTGAVHAYTLKGRWHYLEHDWVAEPGSYVFEPPGETHTLVVPEGCEEMLTLFFVHGALTFVDPEGRPTGYDDVFTRLDKYRAHFRDVGLGDEALQAFIR